MSTFEQTDKHRIKIYAALNLKCKLSGIFEYVVLCKWTIFVKIYSDLCIPCSLKRSIIHDLSWRVSKLCIFSTLNAIFVQQQLSIKNVISAIVYLMSNDNVLLPRIKHFVHVNVITFIAEWRQNENKWHQLMCSAVLSKRLFKSALAGFVIESYKTHE